MKKIRKHVTGTGYGMVQCVLLLMLISVSVCSQNVAINTTLAPANTAAGLDIDFPAQGFLIPRVPLSSTTSHQPLGDHVAGMVVYNSGDDIAKGIYVDDGSKWVAGAAAGATPGDMQYWDGTKWAAVTGGLPGQYLTAGTGGVPQWTGSSSGYATLSTSSVTDILTTTATCGGTITDDGGFGVTARGVCWSTSPVPTTSGSKTTDGSGTGAFTSSITGLSTGTTYYIRSYATNISGTVYGNQITFTTN